MAYDALLAERVRDLLLPRAVDLAEIKMFGGLCFTSRGNMVVGVEGDRLMIRFPKDRQDEILGRGHVSPMDFTGKVMRGFAFVDAAGCRTDRKLAEWIGLSLAYVDALPPKKPRKRKPAPRKTPAKP